MTRSDYRALLLGMGLLGMAALLYEVLAFRLAVATISSEVGTLVGVLGPVAGAAGALFLGRMRFALQSPDVSVRASNLAAFAGASGILSGIGLTWASQGIAWSPQGKGVIYFGVGLLLLLLPPFFAGGAMALAYRRGVSNLGRVTSVEAFGGSVACLLLPVVAWVGYPRAALIVSALFGLSALAFGFASPRRRIHWALIASVPCIVFSLVAGDIGDQWLDVRVSPGRYSRVDTFVWGPMGLLSVERLDRGRANLRIDRKQKIELARKRTEKAKPRSEVTDLGFAIRTEKGERAAPALIVGITAVREVDVAVAFGASRVDVIDANGRAAKVLLGQSKYQEFTNRLHGRPQVKLHIGAPRSVIGRLASDYATAVVLDEAHYESTMPRFLSQERRHLTKEAITAYLDHLTEQGTLVVSFRAEELYAIAATVAAAMGVDRTAVLAQIHACAGPEQGILLASKTKIEPAERKILKSKCRLMGQVLPVPDPPKKGEDKEEEAAEVEKKRAEVAQRLAEADVATDDRPFLRPPSSDLPRAVVASWRASVPEVEADRRARQKWEREKRKADRRASIEAPARPVAEPAALALSGALVAFLVGLLALVWPPPRPPDGDPEAVTPWLLRASLPLFGAALALCSFALFDGLLPVFDDRHYRWSLLVPAFLVGIGVGRLARDSLKRETLRRSVFILFAIGLVWLLALYVGQGPLGGLRSASAGVRIGVGGGLALVSGALLGFPLVAAAGFLGRYNRAAVSWAYGAHASGWALGMCLAAVLARYLGLAKLWPLGLACFALGAVLAIVGSRNLPVQARWYLTQLRTPSRIDLG